MIIDLQKFITEERPFWSELEGVLEKLEKRPELRLSLSRLERFHYLYQRASGDLAKIKTFSAEPNTRVYLEFLVEGPSEKFMKPGKSPIGWRPCTGFFQPSRRPFVNTFVPSGSAWRPCWWAVPSVGL